MVKEAQPKFMSVYGYLCLLARLNSDVRNNDNQDYNSYYSSTKSRSYWVKEH